MLSVDPICVNAGNVFSIAGTGFYSSLVTSVFRWFALASTQFTAASDTLIKVLAPEQSGESLPVTVQTGEGVSNFNVTIEISVIDLCSTPASRKSLRIKLMGGCIDDLYKGTSRDAFIRYR